ncbi:PDR/VanB family oxidoreductase [Rhizobium sp. FKY42]|uniref:PDR/VanB family oxidoreductase n=1 Tax=Rhizobium sp. FKY42 TaxID=2562310 RepID=UPI0010C01DC9|nr:PDR/VanB family oxidoreductase [Rhizobium sp. FKY42]
MDVIVSRKTPETPDIVTVELVSAQGCALPPFTAGAHVDVTLPGGMIRQYSLCNASDETHRYVLGVLRDPKSRGGSKALHDTVSEGDRLTISAPKNLFPLIENGRRSVLLAGGIGITPLLSMAERLSDLRLDFELHYFTRSAERTAFRQRLGASAFRDRVRYHFDDEGPAPDMPALIGAAEAGRHLYVCGPSGFMTAVLSAAKSLGWAEEQLHSEAFSADLSPRESDDAFEVVLARRGRTLTVAKGETVIAAMEAAGVDHPISCEQGVCGTCIVGLLEGIPDHRDMFLTPTEQAANKHFLPCCSRAKSARIVLDI